MALHRLPIEDCTAPPLTALVATVRRVRAALARGEGVLVHCMAGLGRAGTLAAAVLIAGGMKPGDAILLVRWVRPGAIEVPEQEAALRALACLRMACRA